MGEGKGCVTFAKTIIIAFNIISLICGALLLAMGIWITTDGDRYIQMFGSLPAENGASRNFLNGAARAMFGVGITILSTSSLSFISVARMNKFWLYLYAGVLACFLIAEIAGVIMGAIFAGELETLLTTGLLGVLVDYESDFKVNNCSGEVTYNNEDSDVVIQTIESIQIQFECCGVFNSSDYVNTTFPVSCCKLDANSEPSQVARQFWNSRKAETFIFDVANGMCPYDYSAISGREGCYTKMRSYLLTRANVCIAVAATVFIVQMALFFLAIYLASQAEGQCCDPKRNNAACTDVTEVKRA